jgi:hypothetical protein
LWGVVRVDLHTQDRSQRRDIGAHQANRSQSAHESQDVEGSANRQLQERAQRRREPRPRKVRDALRRLRAERHLFDLHLVARQSPNQLPREPRLSDARGAAQVDPSRPVGGDTRHLRPELHELLRTTHEAPDWGRLRRRSRPLHRNSRLRIARGATRDGELLSGGVLLELERDLLDPRPDRTRERRGVYLPLHRERQQHLGGMLCGRRPIEQGSAQLHEPVVGQAQGQALEQPPERREIRRDARVGRATARAGDAEVGDADVPAVNEHLPDVKASMRDRATLSAVCVVEYPRDRGGDPEQRGRSRRGLEDLGQALAAR